METTASITTQQEPCSICLNLGAGQSDNPRYSKGRNISPSLRELKQSAKVANCQSCNLLWDALNSHIKPEICEADLDETVFAQWKSGHPLTLSFGPQNDFQRCVELDLFSRDANTCQSYPMLGPSLEIDSHSSAPANLAVAAQWLQDCLVGHGESYAHIYCDPATPVPLPTRLIDVGASAASIRDPFLVETNGALGTYVAVSYCWGDALSHPPFETTTQNFAQHKRAIPLTNLPATLRDAIFITTYLGFQYIWIDSVCIIQDNGQDWAAEAGRLHQVYSNATLTITADQADGSSSGIFAKQTLAKPPQELQLNGRSVFVRNNTELDHVHGVWDMPASDEREPINRRAWTLQESLLSRRTLRYASKELLWTCYSFYMCACRRTDPSPLHSSQALSWQYTEKYGPILISEAREMWCEFVSIFTSRTIRYHADRLPALAGMAEFFATLCERQFGWKDRYIAGMWERDFPRELLWHTFDYVGPSRGSTLKTQYSRPSEWRAPTWSWASVEGQVSCSYSSPDRIDIEIIEINVEPLSHDNPYGQLRKGANLVVRAPLLHGLIATREKYQIERIDGSHQGRFDHKLVDDKSGGHSIMWDHWDSLNHVDGDTYSCLKIGGSDQSAILSFFLVLRKLSSGINHYERVGIHNKKTYTEESVGLFDTAEKQTIIIF